MTALPPVDIVWNAGMVGEWRALYRAMPRATLPQSFAYADAAAREEGFAPRLGRIVAAGETVGMVQVLERRYVKAFAQRRLHRGPLWSSPTPDPATVEATLRLLRRACPGNLLNNFSFLPELPAAGPWADMLLRAGFRRVGPGYRTAWIDLTRPLSALRAAWSQTAGQLLRKAEKAGLAVDVDPKAATLPWLMAREQQQAAVKGYRPLSGRFAVRLRNALAAEGGALLISVREGDEIIAGALFFIHGGAATYQVGWAGGRGRELNAMRLALWRAFEVLRAQGVAVLDLGGINAEHAAGVTQFKLSLGGELVETAGLYR